MCEDLLLSDEDVVDECMCDCEFHKYYGYCEHMWCHCLYELYNSENA